MPRISWAAMIGEAIAPLGAVVMFSAAIAQTEPLPDPIFVPDALQNLADNYNVPWLQDSDSFDADAPLLRRDYIIYSVAAFDVLNAEIAAYYAQEQERIDNACFVLEIALNYLSGRVDRLQREMENVRPKVNYSSSKNVRLTAISPIYWLQFSNRKIQSSVPINIVQSSTTVDYSDYYFWFYAVDLTSINTTIPHHDQPLTQGEFVGYLSPTLDGVRDYVMNASRFSGLREDLNLAGVRLIAVFDQVAEVRRQLEMVQQLNQAVSPSQNKLAQKLVNQLDSMAIEVPFVPVSSVDSIYDVSSSDPVYDALLRTTESYGIYFNDANGYVYPDDVLTVGDFANYQQQWVRRSVEIVQTSAPIDYFSVACGNEFAETFLQEIVMIEEMIQRMETELQQLIQTY